MCNHPPWSTWGHETMVSTKVSINHPQTIFICQGFLEMGQIYVWPTLHLKTCLLWVCVSEYFNAKKLIMIIHALCQIRIKADHINFGTNSGTVNLRAYQSKQFSPSNGGCSKMHSLYLSLSYTFNSLWRLCVFLSGPVWTLWWQTVALCAVRELVTDRPQKVDLLLPALRCAGGCVWH